MSGRGAGGIVEVAVAEQGAGAEHGERADEAADEQPADRTGLVPRVCHHTRNPAISPMTVAMIANHPSTAISSSGSVESTATCPESLIW